jgi:superfamily II DNA or RNA helicase/diadenosine tetraphosphate (Ap4A) HIT family hydrolase/HKD family nuclease
LENAHCPFCRPDPERVFHRDPSGFICLWDGFPVSIGHALVVPTRHVSTWFDATREEQATLLEGIEIAKRAIESRFSPDGYNIGINAGLAAGQTVPHLHVHVIPRYTGDVPDPRGGVRYVIPDKANYLRTAEKPAPYPVGPDLAGTAAVLGSQHAPMLPVLQDDLANADRVDLAVAFVLQSGLAQIESYLHDILDAGGTVRFLTGDYLDVTEPKALHRLLDLQRLCSATSNTQTFECRVFATNSNIGFHPKSYLIRRRGGDRIAYIGSSNLSRFALTRGIEWNYRLSNLSEPRAVTALESEFDSLFHHPNTVPLSDDWIASYQLRRVVNDRSSTPVEVAAENESASPPPEPHGIQVEALHALGATRAAGNKAGLVVLATGLGKTWLAAFDSKSSTRVLFVAHREEILRQACDTFRRIRPESAIGFYTGSERAADADVMFASVQTIGRTAHLKDFARDAFDYIVIDEFHHAAAATYRKIIDHFEPDFLLGLTATPDRTDGADLLALCAENLVFECGLAEGIRRELLCPFRYYGVPDDIDFSNIPWRSGRFDPAALEHAVVTEKRARNAFEQWSERKGTRTLGFCVTQRHSDFMAEFFKSNGVRAVSVHSGPGSSSRSASLAALERGELDVVFSVDMFNEGVDAPLVDTLLMLRPTGSKILWLQQFGRGLRRAATKPFVTVIDYIGNHKAFLGAPMALFGSDGNRSVALNALLAAQVIGEPQLPAGCSVTYDLQALELLRKLAAPTRPTQAARTWYRSFRERNERRPTASEAFHAGHDPAKLRSAAGSWPGFVDSEGDLTATEMRACQAHRQFLGELETTPMSRSYKMLVLSSMIAADAFPGVIAIEELVQRVRHKASRTPLLVTEFGDKLTNDAALRELLEDNPINAWVSGAGTGNHAYFAYQDGQFSSLLRCTEEDRSGLVLLVEELCDYRLAKYLERRVAEQGCAPRIICSVSNNGKKPILFLPDRSSNPGIPTGAQKVIADGVEYTARFAKIAVNVLKESDSSTNSLPAILREWFGEEVGQPGRSERVQFAWDGDCYRMSPL